MMVRDILGGQEETMSVDLFQHMIASNMFVVLGFGVERGGEERKAGALRAALLLRPRWL
jgi:hypothetical protein